MKNVNYIVFDFETGGKNPRTCSPIQIAAVVVEPKTLSLVPGAVFNQMMQPETKEEFDAIEDEALAINKKTREQIKAAPLESLVWKDFASFVNKYKNASGAPIATGQFIYGYDMIICERLCRKYGPWDKKREQQNLFNQYDMVDLKNILFMWFENCNEPANLKLDTIRDYMGLSKENAHDALQDVQDTALIFIKFMKLHRLLTSKVSFKDSFKNGKHKS